MDPGPIQEDCEPMLNAINPTDIDDTNRIQRVSDEKIANARKSSVSGSKKDSLESVASTSASECDSESVSPTSVQVNLFI